MKTSFYFPAGEILILPNSSKHKTIFDLVNWEINEFNTPWFWKPNK